MSDKSHHVKQKRLEITQQQLSVIAALCILSTFFIFIAGVIAGKKMMLTAVTPIENELTNSFTYLCFTDRAHDLVDARQDLPTGSADRKNETYTEEIKHLYYASLRGFIAYKEALSLIRILKAQGIPSSIITRTSSTIGGISYSWYEVITIPTSLADEQSQLLKKAKRYIKIRKDKIIEITPEQKEMLFKERHVI